MTPLGIVGLGRVGSVFARCAHAAGRDVRVFERGEPVGALGGPIVVCTRADDLEDVIARTAPAARPDLVLVQNGLLAPLLARHGLSGVTQGVLYFAATARDGRAEPGGDSLLWGPHAGEVVAVLRAGDVPARVVPDAGDFRREAAFKLGWNAVFGLLGERFGEAVGETLARHDDLVAALCTELAPALGVAFGAEVPADALHERLVAYSSSIPGFRAGVKELAWRNGILARTARAHALPTPLHDRLLAELGRADVDGWLA